MPQFGFVLKQGYLMNKSLFTNFANFVKQFQQIFRRNETEVHFFETRWGIADCRFSIAD